MKNADEKWPQIFHRILKVDALEAMRTFDINKVQDTFFNLGQVESMGRLMSAIPHAVCALNLN